MKVKLIQVTQNPIDVMWTAARTCYSAKSPIEMWEELHDYSKYFTQTEELISVNITEDATNDMKKQEEKRWNLVKKVLDSGHQSIAETVVFTFSIEGVSRSLTHQLVRHRLACYSQQSQRYVNFKDKTFEYVTPDTIKKNVGAEVIYNEFMSKCKEYYDKLIDIGIPAEDARYVLPNAACTNINMTVNLRELIHICNLRLCTRAQKEIRELFKLIKQEVMEVDERLGNLLVPSCEVRGICFEGKCCGRKPQISDVMNNYNAMRSLIKVKEADDTLSTEDFELLKESMKNPQFNEKLAKFLKEPTVFDDYNDICKELQELREKMQQNSWERDEND